MSGRSTFADIVQTLFERRGSKGSALQSRSIDEMCHALLDVEGEVSGIALAEAVLDRYAGMDPDEKLRFFQFLNTDLEIDPAALRAAVSGFQNGQSIEDYRRIGRLAEPRRQELLRRLNQPTGATQALVNMRADLIRAKARDTDLARTDQDFQHLLRSWFNRGFLVLRQINWDTPASILEKIVAYEAVHAIQDWDDLRRRLYPQDRRCFAFFHPSMPDEPLIFVEVALTLGVPDSIQHVLSEHRDHREAEETKVAVFYSISNCQEGLAGVSFGSMLIKQVVAELSRELPQLETFVTLSPIPRLAEWTRSVNGEDPSDDRSVRAAASDYLLTAKDAKGRPFDPVARFHLGNGAQVYAVHAEADLSENGVSQSFGAMVNYQYDLSKIEQNHERFVQDQEVSLAPQFKNSQGMATNRKRILA